MKSQAEKSPRPRLARSVPRGADAPSSGWPRSRSDVAEQRRRGLRVADRGDPPLGRGGPGRRRRTSRPRRARPRPPAAGAGPKSRRNPEDPADRGYRNRRARRARVPRSAAGSPRPRRRTTHRGTPGAVFPSDHCGGSSCRFRSVRSWRGAAGPFRERGHGEGGVVGTPGGPHAAPHPPGDRRSAAPAALRLAAVAPGPGLRRRHGPELDPAVGPAGHRQDHAGLRPGRGHRPRVRRAVGDQRRREGGPGRRRPGQAGTGDVRPRDPPVPRRDPPLLQGPAGLAAPGRGEPLGDARRRHHREPALLRRSRRCCPAACC